MPRFETKKRRGKEKKRRVHVCKAI